MGCPTSTGSLPGSLRTAMSLARWEPMPCNHGTPATPSAAGRKLQPNTGIPTTCRRCMISFGTTASLNAWWLAGTHGRLFQKTIIRWHDTHVCPVGNQCPAEVIANIGAMNRCGICPLAAKCIDHLPAIDAKQSELHERIKTAGTRQRLRVFAMPRHLQPFRILASSPEP